MGVVVTEGLFDLIDDLSQQVTRIENGIQALTEGGHNLQALGAVGDPLFQGVNQLPQLAGHAIEGIGQTGRLNRAGHGGL